MKPFEVILVPEAQADIHRLDGTLQTRILDKLAWMGHNTEMVQHRPLHGEEWAGCYRYRVGNYRIIYQVDWNAEKLVVLKVGHRRDIYL